MGGSKALGGSVIPNNNQPITTITASCCPTYAKFERSRNLNNYYAYDNRTNTTATTANLTIPGEGRYWASTPVGLHPQDRYNLDDAVWLSVPKDQTTELEIHMPENVARQCISNCSFRIDNPNVASLITTAVSVNKATLEISGVGEGDATLIVQCGGKDIGWFHIWCAPLVTLNLNVCTIKSSRASAVSYDHEQIQIILNQVFKQALLQFNVVDRGIRTMNSYAVGIEDKAHEKAAAAGRQTGTSIWDGLTLHRMLLRTFSPRWRAKAFKNYAYAFYELPGKKETFDGSTYTDMAGVVPEIGERYGISFNNKNYYELAHEVGHMLGLAHPDGSGAARPEQFAPHLLASLNKPVIAQTEINTDLDIRPEPSSPNVMALDPRNLMGYTALRVSVPSYWSKLGIKQCKACRRG